MKTKVISLFAAIMFILPFSASAEKQFFLLKLHLIGEQYLEIFVTVEETVEDFDLDITGIFHDLKEKEMKAEECVINDLIYDEPDVDDWGFDTRAVFEEITNKKAK